MFLTCVAVSWQHYQPTRGAEGVRVDQDKRPELSMGSYEILGSQKVSVTRSSLAVWTHLDLLFKYNFEALHMLGFVGCLTSPGVRTTCPAVSGGTCCPAVSHRCVGLGAQRRTPGLCDAADAAAASPHEQVRRVRASFTCTRDEVVFKAPPCLCREEGDALSGVRVGLMTYDSRIHLYDLSPALSRPHMLVIAETEELQLPVREGLLVPLRHCISSIER